MIILKPNANQRTANVEMVDLIDQYLGGQGDLIRVVYGSFHIDILSDLQEIYGYLDNGEEVAIDLSVNKDWLQEQRELEA